MRARGPLRALLAAGLGAALSGSPVAAGQEETRFGDAEIASMVRQQLADAKIAENVPLDVSVEDGVVTLAGKLENVWARDRAVRMAMEVAGVQAVESELEILPAESDGHLSEEVAKAVLRYPFFTVYDDVNVRVHDGAVTLTGRVTWPFKAEELGNRVSQVSGVRELENEIQVLPVDSGDDRIRRALAYRIYRELLFVDLANRVNPPIHIIVERGRVTLTGVVRSEVERRRAEIIARSTFGVFSVENRLTIG